MLDPQTGDERARRSPPTPSPSSSRKGELKHEANWGIRKMAYEIDKQGEADYRFYRFTGGKDLLDDLDHSLKITDGVLRFRIFKVDADSPTIVPPDTEQIMRRDDDDRERGGRRGGDDGPARPPPGLRPAGERTPRRRAPAAAAAPPSPLRPPSRRPEPRRAADRAAESPLSPRRQPPRTLGRARRAAPSAPADDA